MVNSNIRYIVWMLLVFCCEPIVAQQKLDSLEQVLLQTKSDTARIRLYHMLAEACLDKPEKAFEYEGKALTLSRKINSTEHVVVTLTNIGAIHRRISENEKAHEYFLRAIEMSPPSSSWLGETYLEAGIVLLRMTHLDSALTMLHTGLNLVKEFPDTYLEASLYNMIGNVKREQNQYEDALANYIQAVKLFEQLNNQQGLTQALSNVGNIHNLMGNTDKALEYAEQSLKAAQVANVKSSVAYSYRLLGRIYRKQGKADDALKAYQLAMGLYQEMKARRDVGETQLSIGNIYFDKGDYKGALKEYESAIAVSKTIPDSLQMSYCYVAAGITLLYTKQLEKAKQYFDTVIVISTRKKLSTMKMDSYQALSEVYEAEGNYRLAQQYFKQFINIRDSITQVQSRQEAQEIEARYQSEKKDDAIRILNAQNELKSMQRNYLLLFLALLVVLVAIIYNRYKVKLRANKKLKELDQVKTRFFTNVSHEFRTPLSLIIGPLEEKLRNAGDPEKKSLLLMHRNAKRLQNLINQLLDLSRLEAGNMELHLEESDLVATIRFIGSTFSSLAERKGIAYRQEIPSTQFKGCYDRDKLEKMLNNLLSNAFKFTPDGGVVSMKAAIEQGALIVEVKDSGIGIPDDKIGFIFNRFYQADESPTRSSEGSGIGLALTKELAELHRGKLTVSSREGIGSVFTLTLPVTRDAFRDLPVIVKETEEKNFTSSADSVYVTPSLEEDDDHKPLVLVAEDNEDMQTFIRDLLKDTCRVVTAVDGKEALKQSQAIVPDLVISDWMMPGMDGRTFCEKLKTEDTTCHIPVLMLTARADQSSKLEGLETGADDYLTKPFDTKELQVRVHNLIEQRKKLRQVFSGQLILKPQEIQLPSRDAIFLKKVMNLIEEHHANPEFSVEEWAKSVNMSRMQLHRKLRALTEESPGDFLRKFRLERAKQLLSVAGTQVSEACFKVGFNNVSNFSRAFREAFGVTPSEFIDSVAETK